MLTDKKLNRILKILDPDTIKNIDASDGQALRYGVSLANGAIKQTTDELEANPKYQDLKENLKALSEGLKEVKKRQNAIIQYSLHILEEKAK